VLSFRTHVPPLEFTQVNEAVTHFALQPGLFILNVKNIATPESSNWNWIDAWQNGNQTETDRIFFVENASSFCLA